MSDHRVIKARYADWRTVKGRKVLQITLEVPLEEQADVLDMLGAPMPDRDMWVAVARLSEAQNANAFKGGALSKEAALLCQSGAFRRWVLLQLADEGIEGNMPDADGAAAYVREWCGVESRAMLDHVDEAGRRFREMKGEFDLWMRCAA